MQFQKITLIGVGLLGGSLGLAVKRRRLAGRVEGYVRRTATIAECRKRRAVDLATLDLLAAVSGADLIVLCTPLAQMQPLVKDFLPSMKRGAIVTDVGSVKGNVVKDLEKLITKAGGHFVGSHPMAGAEKTGVSAARVDLFEQAVCVITPTTNSPAAAVRKLEKFWQAVGARTLRLPAETHDVLVARSSHLPHVAAAALALTVLDPKHPAEQGRLCATGFRDTTRVASGSPEMWRDIALANRRNLARSLDDFMAGLKQFQKALARADVAAVTAYFETARQRRDDWCAGCASHSPE